MLRSARLVPRLVTQVIAAGCLALQLSGVLHLAMVEHSLCAEHGEAIDVAESAHSHPAQRGRWTADAAEPNVAPGGGEQSAHHDHCPVAENRGGHALLVRASDAGQSCEPSVCVAPSLQLWSLPPSALRLLAPKTSPPA